MKFFIKNFFSNCDQICSADLVTFTEETFNGNIFRAVIIMKIFKYILTYRCHSSHVANHNLDA